MQSFLIHSFDKLKDMQTLGPEIFGATKALFYARDPTFVRVL
jgi:hypothetical protein